MFNFSFLTQNKYISDISPLLNDYCSITHAMSASGWLGRAVSILTIFAYGPSLVVISELASNIFRAQAAKTTVLHEVPLDFLPDSPDKKDPSVPVPPVKEKTPDSHKKEILKDPKQDKTGTTKVPEEYVSDSEDEIFDQQSDVVVKDDGKKDERDKVVKDVKKDKTVQETLTSDEVLAQLLQDEQQESTDKQKDLGAIFSPFFSDDEDLLSQFLEQEFFANKGKSPSPGKETTKTFKSSEAVKKEKELEMMLKTAEGARQILMTKGLIQVTSKEDEDDPKSKDIAYYEVQGGMVRAVAALVTKEYPHAISLPVLRQERDADIELYIALMLKQFAHIDELKGMVNLPGKKPIKLEGFFDVFATPMVISSYDNFSKKSKFFKPVDREWIISEFNKALYCDYLSKNDVDSMVTRIQDPDFKGPLLIATGFKDHCAAVMFTGDYLLYFDRSSIHAEPGIHVFHIPNRELVTEDFLWELIKREEVDEKNYRVIENILNELNATVIFQQHLPAQTTGNCTHATMQAVLEGLMAMRVLLLENKHSVKNLHRHAWGKAFATVTPEHKKWVVDERNVMFNEVMSEIEEWLTHKTDIGKVDLKQTFDELLSCWLSKPGKRHPVEFQRVISLHEQVQKDSHFDPKPTKGT